MPEAATANPRADCLMTADEVAQWLKVTPAWVYSQTRGHRMPHMRLGRYVRFRRSALEGWMEEMERASTLRSPRVP